MISKTFKHHYLRHLCWEYKIDYPPSNIFKEQVYELIEKELLEKDNNKKWNTISKN